MIAYLLRSLAQAVVVMLAVAALAFAMFRFVGDPVANMVGQEASVQNRAELAQRLGLNDPVPIQFGHFVLGQDGKEACRRPSLLVGLGSDIGPNLLNRGQAQFGEQQFDAGSIDGRGALHATPPARTVPSPS